MSDIKFACPSCGQKIKCDSGHAGARIPCPGCGSELEIPQLEAKSAITEEGSVSSAAGTTAADASSRTEKGAASKGQGGVSASSRRAVGERPDALKEATEELRCLCPVCRSELKVKRPGKAGVPLGTLPVAELVRPGSSGRFAPSAPQPESIPAKTESAPPSPKARPLGSGDAPAERPTLPGLGAKPRLSYVLTGKPPAPLPRPDGAPRRKAKGQAPSGSSSGSSQAGSKSSTESR